MRNVFLIAAGLLIVVGLTAWLGLREPDPLAPSPGAPDPETPYDRPVIAPPVVDMSAPRIAPKPPADGPAWTLSVLVEDETGRPLDDARVFFIGVSKSEKNTGRDGRALLSVRGSGALGVVHRSRAPRRIDGLTPPDSGERHVVVTLGAGREITGVVLDPEGRPVGWKDLARLLAEPVEADPWYSGAGAGAPVFKGRTDADGEFTIRFLPPGRFRITVSSIKGSRFAGPKTAVTADAGESGVTIRLEPVLSLRLRLIDDATGEPVTAHTSVRTGTEPDEKKWVFGQHEGLLKLEGLPAREVRLDVEAQGFAPIRSLQAEAEEGEPSRDITVRLRRGESPRLAVMVEDASGEPLTRIRVTRTTVVGGVTTSMNEDYEAADGRFEVPISPGRHRLRVGSTGENDLIPSDVEISAKAGEVIEKSVRLALGGSIWIAGEDLEIESGGRTTRRTVRVLAEGGARLRPETKEHPAGGLHFRRLSPGVVVLSWNRDGEAVRTRVTVVAGETLRARLR